MEEMVDQKVGAEAHLKLELKAGKLQMTFVEDTKGIDVAVGVSVEVGYFMGKLAALIPGQVDDAVIAVIVAALKAA